jgi:signal transduction histidine kinase
MSAPTSPPAPAEPPSVRFQLAIQQTRFAGYCISFVAFLIGYWMGVIYAPLWQAISLLVIAWSSIALFAFAAHHRVEERFGVKLMPFWLGCDILLANVAAWISGGIDSFWYLWFIAIPASAAFTGGMRAALWSGVAAWGTYTTMLYFGGQLNTPAAWFTVAIRILFLGAASSFALRGIVNLQKKRGEVAVLRADERRKVEALTNLNVTLTDLALQLDERTHELAQSNEQLSDLNDRLQEHDRLKSEFLANMSHELRTPLNAIIGFAEILSERLQGDIHPRYVGFLESILGSGQHLLSVINDVLDLSKIEAGKMDFYPEPFDVAANIESVCGVVRGTAAKQGIVFDVEAEENLPYLDADPARFKQILYNLLSNAVKFSPMGGTVTIRASMQHDAMGQKVIAVSVTDRGIGIALEHREVIFEEFRQVEGTSTRGYGGTGLGLALVKRFVERQGGTVTVQSELGVGSTFTFTLPLIDQTQTPQPARGAARSVSL